MRPQPTPAVRLPRPGRVLGMVAVTALLAVIGCEDGGAGPAPQATASSTTTGGDRREITVRGRVSRVVEPHLFEIAGSGHPPDAEAVIVVNPDQRQPVRPGDHVEVTGTVRPFRRAVFEAEFGFRFEGVADEFEGRSCMVATRLAPSRQRPSPPR